MWQPSPAYCCSAAVFFCSVRFCWLTGCSTDWPKHAVRNTVMCTVCTCTHTHTLSLSTKSIWVLSGVVFTYRCKNVTCWPQLLSVCAHAVALCVWMCVCACVFECSCMHAFVSHWALCGWCMCVCACEYSLQCASWVVLLSVCVCMCDQMCMHACVSH